MIQINPTDTFPYSLNEAGETYVLHSDITTPGTAFVVNADNITLDLNGKTVTFGTAGDMYRYGIAIPPGYHHVNPVWSSSDIPNVSNGKFPTIKNGSIIQGGAGSWCFGIGIYGGMGLTVDKVTIHMKGGDSWPITSDEGTGPYIITRCVIDDSESRIVTNRHQGRGIHIEGDYAIVHENVIDTIEEPAWDEYPSVFTHGIKLEGCNHAEIYDNAVTSYAINNIPEAAGGAAALNVATFAGSYNHIFNNEFRAVNLFGSLYTIDNYGLYATPLELLECQDGAVVEIHNNRFLSNDKFITFRELNPLAPSTVFIRDNTFEQLVEEGVTPSGRPLLIS